MAEESGSNVLYEDRYIRITSRTIQNGVTSYPLSKVAGVTEPAQRPLQIFSGFLLNGIVCLFGLWAIAHFSLGWIITGVMAVLVGSFNMREEFNRPWLMFVRLGDEEMQIRRLRKGEIDRIYIALCRALQPK